jgi:hypothetical protein
MTLKKASCVLEIKVELHYRGSRYEKRSRFALAGRCHDSARAVQLVGRRSDRLSVSRLSACICTFVPVKQVN